MYNTTTTLLYVCNKWIEKNLRKIDTAFVKFRYLYFLNLVIWKPRYNALDKQRLLQ